MLKIRESLVLPLTDFKKFLLGMVLYHPMLLSIGVAYGFLCGRRSYQGKIELVEWRPFKRVFFMTIRSFIIVFLYFLVAWGFLFLLNIHFLAEFTQVMGVVANPLKGVLLVFNKKYMQEFGSLPIFLVCLAFAFFLYLIFGAVMLVFVINNKIWSAFKIPEIFRIVFTRKYLCLWLAFLPVDILLSYGNVILYVRVGQFLQSQFIPLSWVIIIGLCLSPLHYIFDVAFFSLLGQIMRELKYKPEVKKK